MALAVHKRGIAACSTTAPLRDKRLDELLPLAKAAAAKDPAAAASLIMHLGPFVLKVVRGAIGRGHPDVEDVAQEAVIAVLSSLPTFRGESSVLHYVGRVTLFTALAWRRKERQRARRMESEAPGEPLHDPVSDTPLAELIARRRREILVALLDTLPEATADALALHFILGYTVEEIARAADVSEHTIWSRLRLGKEALAQKLVRDSRLAEILRSRP